MKNTLWMAAVAGVFAPVAQAAGVLEFVGAVIEPSCSMAFQGAGTATGRLAAPALNRAGPQEFSVALTGCARSRAVTVDFEAIEPGDPRLSLGRGVVMPTAPGSVAFYTVSYP